MNGFKRIYEVDGVPVTVTHDGFGEDINNKKPSEYFTASIVSKGRTIKRSYTISFAVKAPDVHKLNITELVKSL